VCGRSGVREAVRPGGRSARVQASVHEAVCALSAEMDRAALTVPMIAERAGVTPSTIYRRWGDLRELLADVAVERMRPDQAPLDTGSLRGDLEAWLDQYAEEMSSTPGRTLLRDALAGDTQGENGCRCCEYGRGQLSVIVERATARGERTPTVEAIIDLAVAPVTYRILFDAAPPPPERRRAFIDAVLTGGV